MRLPIARVFSLLPQIARLVRVDLSFTSATIVSFCGANTLAIGIRGPPLAIPDQPRHWLIRIGPYAMLVIRALQLVVPVAASVAGVALPDEQFKHAQHEIELMKTLVADLPDQQMEAKNEFIAFEPGSQLTPAEGQAARAIRVLLFEHDPMREFGDLRRVQAPSGEFIWVCTSHYGYYDPGLPSIPGSEP